MEHRRSLAYSVELKSPSTSFQRLLASSSLLTPFAKVNPQKIPDLVPDVIHSDTIPKEIMLLRAGQPAISKERVKHSGFIRQKCLRTANRFKS